MFIKTCFDNYKKEEERQKKIDEEALKVLLERIRRMQEQEREQVV